MSAEVLSAGGIQLLDADRTRSAQIFRLAFGMTLSAGIAFGLAWPLAFITPVIAAKLLTMPRVLPPKAAAGFIVVLGGSLFLSTTFLLPTLEFPAVHLLLTALILFLLFYAKAGGTNPILIVLLMLGVLVVPLVGTVSHSLAAAAAWGIVFSTAVAIGVVYVVSAVFPGPASSVPAGKSPGQGNGTGTSDPLPQSARIALASRSLVVLYPLAVVFLYYSLVPSTVVLVMASFLVMEPTFGKHLAAGKGLVLGNLAGGLVAVAIYNLLVWVPAYPFFLLLVLLAGLWVGGWIFSDRALGKLFSVGITAVFLILGPTVTGQAEAGAKLYVRVALIIGAVLYVVLAFGLLERLTRGRRRVA